MPAATREGLRQVKPVTPVWRSYSQATKNRKKKRHSDSRSLKLPLRSYLDPNPRWQTRSWFKNKSFPINISNLFDAGETPARIPRGDARALRSSLARHPPRAWRHELVFKCRFPNAARATVSLPRTGGGLKRWVRENRPCLDLSVHRRKLETF